MENGQCHVLDNQGAMLNASGDESRETLGNMMRFAINGELDFGAQVVDVVEVKDVETEILTPGVRVGVFKNLAFPGGRVW